MKASLNWLKRLVDLRETPEEVASRLTAAGLEVEAIERVGDFPGVVVGEVRACEKVEGTKLSRCLVWDGARELPVVCGAANVRAGLRTALATVGAKLPGGLEIRPAEIRGLPSQGMLCAADELGLSEDHAGILELDPSLEPGRPLGEALGLADVVFEINVTPNRPDATGHLGLARELALSLGRPLRVVHPELPLSRSATEVPVTVEPGCGCTRYVGRTVRGVRNGASPAWMQALLRAVGSRPVSALVDITNFVMFETGQPLHVFDLARLSGPAVNVRGARPGETLEILDGRKLSLRAGDLVVADAHHPQCLGGVMGGAASGVSEGSVDIFLETACFEAPVVRRLARRSQVGSDSSYRFERGVDPFATRAASDLATSLVLGICGGEADLPVDVRVEGHPIEPRRVMLRRDRVARLLGMDVPEAEQRRLLAGVGCVEDASATTPEAVAWDLPGWRPDLHGEADLVEEVARLVGYDAIPADFPSFPVASVRIPERERWTRRLRRALASRGLCETLSLRLCAQADHDLLRLPADDPRAALVALLNPLSDETACLPRLLVGSLLRAARRNGRRQERAVRLFECGRVFGRDLPEPFGAHRVTGVGERLAFAGVLAGPRVETPWDGSEAAWDVWSAKGVLQGAMRDLGLEPEFSTRAPEPWLHPGRSVRVRVDGFDLGWFGQLHPEVQEVWELRDPVFAWELDLDALLDRIAGRDPVRSAPMGEFPATRREANLLVARSRPAAEVVALCEEAARGAGGPLESVSLASVYEGPGLPEGSKAVLVRFVYRAVDRTLVDAEVNALQDGIRQTLSSLPGVALK